MNETKFKVGDKVIAKKNPPYSLTRDGWVGEVISVDDKFFWVENKEQSQGPYRVEAQYFDLYTPQKYKVGDRVRIRSDLVIGEEYDGIHFFDGMKQHVGEVEKISVADDDTYFVFDNWFSEAMLEPAEPQRRYKIGDIVRVRNDLIVNERYYNDDGVTYDSFVDGMVEFKGRVFKIREHKTGVNGREIYLLETTDGEEIGWNWTDGMLEPVGTKTECNKKVVIETDGEITTATLYDGETIIKMATAKCMPDDEFDFECGLNIALDRLIEAEPQGLK